MLSFRHNRSGKITFYNSYEWKVVSIQRVVQWKMHLIKSSEEDAFVHSKMLFVKSKIICKQFTSVKSFATDMEVRSHGSHTDGPFPL